MNEIPCYEIYEHVLAGPAAGNPFLEIKLSANFSHNDRQVKIGGFYDGEGIYRIRFMPDELGVWEFTTESNIPEMDRLSGEIKCIPALPGFHGPVYVIDKFHFAYADGTPYHQVGTTCYAWVHQEDALVEQTLLTLAASPFNKLRMCIFPKDYTYNRNEPQIFPYEHLDDDNWDFTRFNPKFWHHLEKRIAQLGKLGIEADLILFHPYDRWGFSRMIPEMDDHYLRYAVNRLAPFHNVWWSLANEYDLMETKQLADWDRFFKYLQDHDPFQHLRSIHNCHGFYDHSQSWVTHCSIQHWDVNRVAEWRSTYGKPVIVDECGYEGNIPEGWGNFSPQEHVRRFWVGTARGGYVGHGETYLHPEDILWWSKGGVLHGESPPRLDFLRRILEDTPAGLEPTTEWAYLAARCGDDLFINYLETHQPCRFKFTLPGESKYKIDVLDTWEMTETPISGVFQHQVDIELPGKPWLAVRMHKVHS
jgi:hypothetical protein